MPEVTSRIDMIDPAAARGRVATLFEAVTDDWANSQFVPGLGAVACSRDDVYRELREYFSEPEIVELTMIYGFFNMFDRLMDPLKIPVENPQEWVN